jgi:hypothetical protein
MEKIYTDLIAALNNHTAALNAFVKANSGKASTAGAGASTGGKTTTKETKGPTVDDIQAKFGAYMAIQDKEERKRRKDIVLKIAGKFGADKATAIDPPHFAEALELLAAYEKGEDPLADETDEDEGGSPI